MWIVGVVGSVALILLMLLEGFEAMVLPRRVTRPYRLTRVFYRVSWTLWSATARQMKPGKRRDAFLSRFGPLSTLMLFATWVAGLIVGFALLNASLGTGLNAPGQQGPFSTYLYLSGVTFFTLGYSDITPVDAGGRALSVVEAGTGFGFLAVIIGYLPVLYQAFSRREVTISMLDARAGSPPTAAQLLLRLARAHHVAAVDPFLAEWERWGAEVLESHVSFPMLSYYRSQHDNQSWLAALTTILDTCALLISGIKGADPYQPQLTFAMARHAVVDLAMVFRTPPRVADVDRLPPGRLVELRQTLQQAGLGMCDGAAFDAKLTELRTMYEPFVQALSHYFLLALPPVLPEKPVVDNWQTSAWTRRTTGIGELPLKDTRDDHQE